MKVTQEKLPASRLGLEIAVTPEMSKQAYEKALKDLTRSANIPGFRKGKVPRQVLLQRFGSSRIKAMALEELVQRGMEQAIEQEKIAAIGNYELRSSFEELISHFEPGQELTFSVAVDVQPEAKLSQHTNLSVKAEEIKPDLSQVDQLLEDRRKAKAALIPVEDRPAQLGDVAIVDFEGRLLDAEGKPGEPIPGGQANNFQIELETERFIPGFVDGIVGMKLEETKEVSAHFPESYPEPTVAGQPAVFTITLKELKNRELPELNDELAQEISEFQTLAELRESLEKRYQQEAERKTNNNKEQALLKELVQYLDVDLPESLIEQEVTYMLTQTAMQLQNQGIDYQQLLNKDTLPDFRQRLRPEAIERIRRTLALREVAKAESIETEAGEVENRMAELVAEYGGSKDIDLKRLREIVEEDLLKEKIMQWLETHSTIELVPEGSLKPAEAPAEASAEATAEATAETDVVASEAIVEATATEVPEAEAPTAAETAPEAEAKPSTTKAKGSKSKKSR